MTPRSIRRAAERKRMKLARKAEKARLQTTGVPAAEDAALPELDFAPEPFEDFEPSETLETLEIPEPFEAPESAISPAQLAANRANAQLSSGPTSPQGKAKSCLNAVKTALTGRTVLLPADDVAEYERLLRAYEKELKPVGQQESDLVQSIADNTWRLRRIPSLELAIFAKGRLQFAHSFDDHEPAERPGLIDLETLLYYEKQLRNLQLQEARLTRRREKERAEFRQLQQLRNRQEKEQLEVAAKLYLAAKHDKKPFDPATYGFEFSIEDVLAYLEGVRAANITNLTLKRERADARNRFKAAA